MNKILLSFNVLTIATSLSLYCVETKVGEEAKTDMVSTFRKNPNFIYFGPEVFCLDLNSHFNGVRVHGAKFFLGLKIGYEYLKPDAFYFGIDILVAGANHGFHESFKGGGFPQSDGRTGFGNLELRFGYTISTPRWLTTPFLCIGENSFGSGSDHHHFDESISYLGGGVRSRYELSKSFNLGVNFKIFSSMYREEKWRFLRLKRVTHNGLWGGEIGIPLIWRVGSKKRWDIQLEPYFLKLTFVEVQNIYGTRLIFGYRF